MAVTFTNKAAREMRERLGKLWRNPTPGIWVGTFHSMAHRLLRKHHQEAGLAQNFQVLDSGDQLRLVRRVARELQLDEEKHDIRELRAKIEAFKERGIRPDAAAAEAGVLPVVINVYREYEKSCADNGLVDFTELLLRTTEMLKKHKTLTEHYQQRFRCVLVDEFQDTNTLQYQFIKLVAGSEGQVFAVGDDDQSIYSWRGAQPGHMAAFSRDFKGSGLLKLEQNYRSAGTILQAANNLIDHNTGRLGKKLWTDQGDGDPIRLFSAYNDRVEAAFVVNDITNWHSNGGKYNQVAILYRANAQSRSLEEAFIKVKIPYRIYGGLRFYEREEIKDAMSYLRLIANRNDDLAFSRVVNIPARRIGMQTMAALSAIARDNACSLWQAAEKAINQQKVAARTAAALQSFIDTINEITKKDNEPLPDLILHVIERVGLNEHYKATRKEQAVVKHENLRELVNAASDFAEAFMSQELDIDDIPENQLQAWLSYTALETGEGTDAGTTDQVHLMTLHAAKGLEFDKVFIVGMEEGLFPHSLCTADPMKLEEERRLCYVGVTRARSNLTLSHAWKRRLYGREQDKNPSRFIRNLPQQLLQPIDEWGTPIEKEKNTANIDNITSLKLGSRVRHNEYGEGVVIDHEGDGMDSRVMVNFTTAGKKWMLADVSSLKPIA